MQRSKEGATVLAFPRPATPAPRWAEIRHAVTNNLVAEHLVDDIGDGEALLESYRSLFPAHPLYVRYVVSPGRPVDAALAPAEGGRGGR